MESWGKEYFASTLAQQASLVQEARRDVARELILKINALAMDGQESNTILLTVIAFCESEIMLQKVNELPNQNNEV